MAAPMTRTSPQPRSGAARARGRPRPAARWEGLDVARGGLVLLAALLGVAGLLAPESLGPTAWLGLHVSDLAPGTFLVVAGAGMGWRHDAGKRWTRGRVAGRGLVLVTCAAAVIAARAGGDLARAAPDELLRLVAAMALAALVVRAARPVVVAAVPVLLLAPAAVVTGDLFGRGLRGSAPGIAYGAELAAGLPPEGVPLASLPAAVGLVLVGYGLGTWVHRRPQGPATTGALLTVAVWAALGTLVVGQVVVPAPSLLVLPVALAATSLAATLLGAGHLAALRGSAGDLAAVGRVAIVPVTLGAVLLGLAARVDLPALPTLAAVTAGALAATGVVALARRLAATGHHLRA